MEALCPGALWCILPHLVITVSHASSIMTGRNREASPPGNLLCEKDLSLIQTCLTTVTLFSESDRQRCSPHFLFPSCILLLFFVKSSLMIAIFYSNAKGMTQPSSKSCCGNHEASKVIKRQTSHMRKVSDR